ncbi:MAG: CPBP family intramembrane glutamic endopeptidase [Vicinamibacterales bacterium]
MLRRSLGVAWAVAWRFLLMLTVWGAAISPFFVLVMPRLTARGVADLPSTWVLIEAVAAVAATASVLLVNRFVDRQPMQAIGLALRGAPQSFALSTVLGAAIIAAAVGILLALGVATWLAVPVVPAATLAIAAVATLINAFTQELLFQGYLLPSLLRRTPALVALVVSGVVFVLVHGPAAILDPIPGLNLFLAGILLGLARIRWNSLWPGLGIHFGWNFVEGPLLGLNVSGHELAGWKLLKLSGPAYLSGGSLGPEGSLAATVMTVAGIVMVWNLRLRSVSHQPADAS